MVKRLSNDELQEAIDKWCSLPAEAMLAMAYKWEEHLRKLLEEQQRRLIQGDNENAQECNGPSNGA